MSEIKCFQSICYLYKKFKYCFLIEKVKKDNSTHVRISTLKNNAPITVSELFDNGFSFVFVSDDNNSGFNFYEKYISLTLSISGIKIFHNDKLVYENNNINFFIKESIKETLHSTVKLSPD
jgi:hypothetical protein